MAGQRAQASWQVIALIAFALISLGPLIARPDDFDELSKRIDQLSNAAEKQFNASRIALACSYPFREVDGSNYCLLPRFQYASNVMAGLAPTDAAHIPCGAFQILWGRVFQITGDGILLKKMAWQNTDDDNAYTLVFVARMPTYGMVDDEMEALYAVPAGVYSYVTTQGARSTIPKYDFGRVLSPEESAALQKDFDDKIKAAVAQRAATDSARKAKMEKDKAAANARALEWNQKQADDGDPYGLLRMGQRYLHGDGVETNLAKARDYLQRSAALGNQSAKDELAKLQN